MQKATLGEHQEFWKAQSIGHRISKSIAGSGNQPKQSTLHRNCSWCFTLRLQEIGVMKLFFNWSSHSVYEGRRLPAALFCMLGTAKLKEDKRNADLRWNCWTKYILVMETPEQSLYALNISLRIQWYLKYKLHHDFDKWHHASSEEIGTSSTSRLLCLPVDARIKPQCVKPSLTAVQRSRTRPSKSLFTLQQRAGARRGVLTYMQSRLSSFPVHAFANGSKWTWPGFSSENCLILRVTFKLLGAVFHRAAPKKDTRRLLHLTLLDKVISHDLPAATFSLILSTM